MEELLELTHLSLRQYQAPTGEMVPLVQVSPSKTDTERVIPADPELVAVLARIIRRIKDTSGRVPLLSRYDTYERVFGPPLPHLFQLSAQHRLQVISPQRVRDLFSKRQSVMPVRWADLACWCDTPARVVDWRAGMVMIACRARSARCSLGG